MQLSICLLTSSFESFDKSFSQIGQNFDFFFSSSFFLTNILKMFACFLWRLLAGVGEEVDGRLFPRMVEEDFVIDADGGGVSASVCDSQVTIVLGD